MSTTFSKWKTTAEPSKMGPMIRLAPSNDLDSERLLVAAARRGDHEAWRRLTEPLRRELQLHCYRMLGSLHDAEDILQEGLLRAWQKLHTFRGSGTFRSWLYKITSNVCLNALKRRPRRVLPSTYTPPADPDAPVLADVVDPIWLEPYPDALLDGVATNPEAILTLRESVSLAFLAAVQFLTPRQRAALLLQDVLGWRAAEVAKLLDVSVASVNSALQRARSALRKRFPVGAPDGFDGNGMTDDHRGLLERYISAWEAGDAERLAALLKEDAVLTMPPTPSWYRGRAAIARFFATTAFRGELGGRLHLVPTRANLQPAVAIYRRDPDGVLRAMALKVLTTDVAAIREITGFVDPKLFPAFGLPRTMPLTASPTHTA